MNIAVIGSRGMLGYDLCSLLSEQDVKFFPLDIEELDITDGERVTTVLSTLAPQIIINCAAYTNVDGAEEEVDLALRVNHIGPKNLAEYAEKNDITLCHISTDYVFDGSKHEPYTEDDAPEPLGVYGMSKLAGEEEVRRIEKHYIIRTSWLYGKNGRNFVSTIIKASQTNDQLKIVNDQFGAPTYTVDLAERIMEIVTHLPYGTYHATNSGITTWYEFAKEALTLLKINTALIPITSDEYPSRVKRPKYSVLNNEKAIRCGLKPMPEWQDAVQRFLAAIE